MATAPARPKSAKKAAATPVKKVASVDPEARKRKLPKYKSLRLQKKILNPAGPLPSAWRLLGKTRRLMWATKKPLLVVFVVYTLISLVMVRNFTSPLNVGDVRNTLSGAFGVQADKTATTGSITNLLFDSSSAPSDVSGIYQTLLIIIVSLALIWIFRQYAAGNKPTAKMAFYRGMYPLVPFLLVVVVMALQLLPAVIGGAIYSIVTHNGIAVSGYEQAIWLLFFLLVLLLSLYMLCSSIFALYIVTLPEMTPLKALRTARQLVLSRRWSVLRKILVLPLLVFLALILIVVPAVYFVGVAAPWLYFVLTLLSIVFLHAYLFTMYRELL